MTAVDGWGSQEGLAAPPVRGMGEGRGSHHQYYPISPMLWIVRHPSVTLRRCAGAPEAAASEPLPA